MDWSDVLLLILLCWGIWTFVPRPLRASLRSGLDPAVSVTADAIREGLRGFERLAYRVLVGRPVPPTSDHLSSSRAETTPDQAPVPPLTEEADQPLQPIATANNNGNEPLPVAPAGATEEEITADAIDLAVARAVALLIVESERKPFHQGVIGETRAIETVFNCTRTSNTNSTYHEARQLVRSQMEQLKSSKSTAKTA